MADGNERPPIPDLRKAAESAPPPAPAPVVAKAAAAAPLIAAATIGVGRRTEEPKERFGAPAKIAAAGAVVLAVSAVFAATALRQGSEGGFSGGLGAIKSTAGLKAFKVGRDSTALSGGGLGARAAPGAKAAGMRMDLITGGDKDVLAGIIPDVPVAGETGAPGGGGAPGQGGKSMTSGNIPAGAAAAKDGAAAFGSSGGGSGQAALGSGSYGKIQFQNMRRVSQTAGFRSITGGRRTGSRTQTLGSGATAADAAGAAGGRSGGPAYSGPGGGQGGGLLGKGAKPRDAEGGASQGGGGGGGGGDGSGGEFEAPEGVDPALSDVQSMMSRASDLRKDAGKEKQHAQILAAQGHMPQAKFHYDRYKDKKQKAEELENKANAQMAELQSSIGAATDAAAAGRTRPETTPAR